MCGIVGENIELDFEVSGLGLGPKFELKQTHIHFDKLLANSKKYIEIQFENIGEITGVIEFLVNDEPDSVFDMIRYHPERLTLIRGEIGVFKLVFIARKFGAFLEDFNFRSVESGQLYKVFIE